MADAKPTHVAIPYTGETGESLVWIQRLDATSASDSPLAHYERVILALHARLAAAPATASDGLREAREIIVKARGRELDYSYSRRLTGVGICDDLIAAIDARHAAPASAGETPDRFAVLDEAWEAVVKIECDSAKSDEFAIGFATAKRDACRTLRALRAS